MGAAYFYHLTREPLERTLTVLLGKALGAGWCCQVVGGSDERRAHLDAALWQGDEASFLAHGLEGGPHDADQPILLCAQPNTAHEAACMMAIDGAEIAPDLVKAKERVCILFDGNDDSAVQTARVQWKTLTDAGCAAQYWSQETDSWVKKAEKSAS